MDTEDLSSARRIRPYRPGTKPAYFSENGQQQRRETPLAIAAGFLSAVADRFGGWGASDPPGVAWGNWVAFVAYTGQLTGWLVTDPGLTQGQAVVSTGLEIVLGLLLIVGYQTRYTALGSGIVLLSFAL